LSSIRKVFWPAAIALSMLVLMAISGQGVGKADAAAKVNRICGPTTLAVGQTGFYLVLTSDAIGDTLLATIDGNGDADITSATIDGSYKKINPTHVQNNIDILELTDNSDIGDLQDIIIALNPTGGDILDALTGSCKGLTLAAIEDEIEAAIIQCIDTSQCTEEWTDTAPSNGNNTEVWPHDVGLSPTEIADAIAAMIFDDPSLVSDCDDLHDAVEDFLIDAGVSEDVAADLANDVQDLCEEEDLLDFGVSVIDVTCEAAGDFALSVSVQGSDTGSKSQAEFHTICGAQEDTSTIDASPASVEIIPAPGNVAHSLIRLIMLDRDGDPSAPGQTVIFTTDRCGLQSSAVNSDQEFRDAEGLFRTDLNANTPASALAVETSLFATTAPSSSRPQQTETLSFTTTSTSSGVDRTVAAAILHCDLHSGSTPTPGVATITAIVERTGPLSGDKTDHIYTTKVTVVGPPASVTVSASPTELRCGEKSAIVVVVKDAIGQNVSDHTQYEAVTNAGGVLGGTGAVIGLAAPVAPISSTVGELFGGTSTFFLLTSEQHSGPYEVVVTTGGANLTSTGLLSGLFSTVPISVQTTVRCTIPVVAAVGAAPSAAPTITAPRTGDLGTTAIRPPSTGDAGLADSSSTSWMLFAIAGAVAFSLVGLATVKVTRR